MYIMEREILLDWMRLIQNGGSIANYFTRKKIDEIIIYGAGDIGLKFYEDMLKSGVRVKCFIDRDVRYVDGKVEVYGLDDINEIPLSDYVIIVASIIYYEEIYDYLKGIFGNARIFSIEDIIYDEILYSNQS